MAFEPGDTYWQLTLVAPREGSDALIRRLRGLTRCSLSALFDGALDRPALLDRARDRLGAAGVEPLGRIRLSALTADDRAEAWPEYAVPVAVGRRLLVVPAWITPAGTHRLVLASDPGGFGTGHHPSTAGCLEALERLVDQERPHRAIDLGSGSGILAIAAARLGVPSVVAIDNDAAAVSCATANAARNGVSDRVRCVLADAETVDTGPAPLVLANLLAGAHVALADRYAGLVTPGGALVLGGIEEKEASDVIAAVAGRGFGVTEQRTIGGWSTMLCSRRAAEAARSGAP